MAVGAFIENWGFRGALGRVWCYLALSRAPLSQAEIARQLGVSRALVSSSIAELERLGLVRPKSARRQAPYEAVIDVWPTIAGVLRTRESQLLESVRSALETAQEAADEASADGRPLAYDQERVSLLLNMTQLAHRLLRFLMTLGETAAATQGSLLAFRDSGRGRSRR